MIKKRDWSEGDVEQLFIKLIENWEHLTILNNGFRYRMKERNSNGKIPDITGICKNGSPLIVEVKDKLNKEKDGITQLKDYMKTEYDNGNSVIGIFVCAESIKKLYIRCFHTLKNGDIKEVEGVKNNLKLLNKTIESYEYSNIITESIITSVENDISKELLKLHELVRNYGKISANEKVILLNSIMIALNSSDFINHLEADNYEDVDFSKFMYTASLTMVNAVANRSIQDAIKSAISFLDLNNHPMNDPNNIPKNILTHHSHIKCDDAGNEITHLSFSKFICNFIWNDIIKPLKQKYKDCKIDISSKFYNEFLKYAKSDGKDLGIVLTPSHISDLMIELLELKPNDIILDNCMGSGAFLISALKKKQSISETENEFKVSNQGLIGVELQPHMYVLAFANVLFNNGNLNNLHYGNCYDEKIINKIKQAQPTCGVINPPYSMYKNSDCDIKLHEWSFIKHSLSLIQPGGKFIAIIPKSCGIHNESVNNQLKSEILSNNRLDAIIQCNDQLFYPTSVVCNIYLFTAGIPHSSNKCHMTFCADFTNDGYIVKNKKRIEVNNFENLKNELLDNYNNMKITKNSNIIKITESSEWDYVNNVTFNLNSQDFFYNKKEFIYRNSILNYTSNDIKINDWKPYKLTDLFEIYKLNNKQSNGNIKLITSSIFNRGTGSNQFTSEGESNILTVSFNGQPGVAFWQSNKVGANGDVGVLKPKFECDDNIGLFLETVITKSLTPKYNYGKKLSLSRIQNESILLPTLNNLPDWNYIKSFMLNI